MQLDMEFEYMLSHIMESAGNNVLESRPRPGTNSQDMRISVASIFFFTHPNIFRRDETKKRNMLNLVNIVNMSLCLNL